MSRTDHHHLDHGHHHDHDHAPSGPLEENPLWQQDNVRLCSVGIDIGSSGTQVVFSDLHLRRISEELTSRYRVVERSTRYRSPVGLTPYAGPERIDAESLGALIDRAYAEAGLAPEAVDTGVVILTGEALRRHNAATIAQVVAERAGELVTAAAGHHMEAMLAAYGSGAAWTSHTDGLRVLTVDIGGGTTKLAVTDGGRVTATAALQIGGRLMAVDAHGRVDRLEPAGRGHAERCGVHWELGGPATDKERREVAHAMADLLLAAVTAAVAEPGTAAAEDLDPEVRGLYLTEPLLAGPVDAVLFSGGVAEYVYDREPRGFGDLGKALGRALRDRIRAGALPAPLLPAGQCIRATVLGASEYSVQLSGNTVAVTDPERLLPRRNLPVVRPEYTLAEHVDPAAVAAAVRQRVQALGESYEDRDVALALPWSGLPSYPRLRAFALGVATGLEARIRRGHPLYLALDGDVALTLGRLLHEELAVAVPLLVLDGLDLHDFDHIDLGRILRPSGTVPVTIKSLVFGQPAVQGADRVVINESLS